MTLMELTQEGQEQEVEQQGIFDEKNLDYQDFGRIELAMKRMKSMDAEIRQSGIESLQQFIAEEEHELTTYRFCQILAAFAVAGAEGAAEELDEALINYEAVAFKCICKALVYKAEHKPDGVAFQPWMDLITKCCGVLGWKRSTLEKATLEYLAYWQEHGGIKEHKEYEPRYDQENDPTPYSFLIRYQKDKLKLVFKNKALMDRIANPPSPVTAEELAMADAHYDTSEDVEMGSTDTSDQDYEAESEQSEDENAEGGTGEEIVAGAKDEDSGEHTNPNKRTREELELDKEVTNDKDVPVEISRGFKKMKIIHE